jgi:hypothetical protein
MLLEGNENNFYEKDTQYQVLQKKKSKENSKESKI